MEDWIWNICAIWQDYWLPGKDQRLISTGKVAGMECVFDLILQNPNRWNKDLIYSTFTVEEADQIVSLLLPITNQSDKVVWSNENSGIYSVKSGYKMLLDPSNVNLNEQKLFKQIWSLMCPSKIHILI